MDKFIISVHIPDEPGSVISESKKALNSIKSKVLLRELWELEKDPNGQIQDSMNFNRKKNCNGLKHIKYA